MTAHPPKITTGVTVAGVKCVKKTGRTMQAPNRKKNRKKCPRRSCGGDICLSGIWRRGLLSKPRRLEAGRGGLQPLLQLRFLGLVAGLAPAGAGPGGDPSGLNSPRAKRIRPSANSPACGARIYGAGGRNFPAPINNSEPTRPPYNTDALFCL